MQKPPKTRLIPLIIVLIMAAGLFLANMQNSFDAHAKTDDKFATADSFMQVMGIIKSSYVDNVTESTLMTGAIRGMLQGLDPHSVYYSSEEFKAFMTDMKGEFGGLGMQIGMKNDQVTVIAPIEDTPASKAGIKAGDFIYKIGDNFTNGMAVDDAVKLMRGVPGTKIKLTILREGEKKPLEFNLVRDIIKTQTVKAEIIADNIGYVRLSSFSDKVGEQIRDALIKLDKAGSKGVILDLRYNPGGSLMEAIAVTSLFVPANKTVVITKSRTKEDVLTTKSIGYRDTAKPLVILVNENSASASEIVAGAVQDHKRGIVLGTTTFGKASVQSILELKNGAAVKLTTARYYTPNGRSIQGVGIIPDVVVQQGTINYTDMGSLMVKEKDLAGHLVGENETTAENKDAQKFANDLQLQSAVQMIRGLTLYAK